jgi:hypothetical protein
MRTRHQRESGEQDRPWRWLRRACFVLAAVETGLLILFMGVMAGAALSSDPLGSAIARGAAGLTAAPLLLFALPALTLAAADRWLPVALALAGLAVLVSILLWRLA